MHIVVRIIIHYVSQLKVRLPTFCQIGFERTVSCGAPMTAEAAPMSVTATAKAAPVSVTATAEAVRVSPTAHAAAVGPTAQK